jgi:hypothetical protein
VFKVTYFGRNKFNTKDGEIVEYQSLEEMGEHFKKCIKGKKDGPYFVRGELDPLVRADVNLKDSRIITLDIDAGKDGGNAESPREFHEHMKELGYRHFIYTSHSHDVGKNRFRCVLLSDRPMIKSESKPTIRALFQELWDIGVNASNTSEQKVWTQPWYLPTRDDPLDGMFEYYEWYGNGAFRDVEVVKGSALDGDGDNFNDSSEREYDTKSWAKHVVDLCQGTAFHSGILSLSWGLLKDGLDDSTIIGMIRGVMELVAEKDARWEQRYKDVGRLVRQGREKMDAEDKVDVSDIETEDENIRESNIPLPPGLLGSLVNDAYCMANYQYKEVALVSALGLVAGICGRKFNVSKTGLNVYLTLIMGTGMGKDSIGKFINGALISLSSVGVISSSFMGTDRFTGPKGVINDLRDARSQVCVLTEAGLLLQSKAGDNIGLARKLLGLYTKSGHMDYSGRESYSKAEDSLPSLRAPALTIVNEATPETLLKAFIDNGNLERGDLARQSIFRLIGKKPRINRNVQDDISQPCQEQLRHLIKKCSDIQATDDFTVHNMLPEDSKLADDMYEFEAEMTDLYNDNMDGNSLIMIMSTRAYVKCLKFAALASVFNHHEAVIKWPEWEWAKALVRYEMASIESLFRGTAFGGIMDELAIRVVGPAIIKLIKHEYKDSHAYVSKQDAEKGVFDVSALRYVLKHNKEINQISDDASSRSNPATGFIKVVRYMMDIGLLRRYGHKKAMSYSQTAVLGRQLQITCDLLALLKK